MLKIGADPEYFLKRGGDYVSAHDVVPGNKREPYRLRSGGAVQADGTAVEFNIVPAILAEEFASNIQAAINDIRGMLDPSLVFDFKPSIIYPKAYFDSLPDFSKDLGCDPDYSAYSGQVNPRPNARATTMRTGAGHIHLGWTEGKDPLDKSHMWDCCEVVKELDHYFGAVQGMWDVDNRRRELYGAQGAFRPKPYGCEYRVLSNAWLNYPKLWPWLFESVKFVFEFVQAGRSYNYPYVYPPRYNELLLEMYGRDVPKIPDDWQGPKKPAPKNLTATEVNDRVSMRAPSSGTAHYLTLNNVYQAKKALGRNG